jgi:AcrR family transcriptional regulator
MGPQAGTARATRERILNAAFALFGRYGYRRTSMEDIAAEAGLSRAALYLQFRNKEEIFRELARGLHEEGLSTAEEVLAGSGPLVERLVAAVEAKTLRMVEIGHTSPHASELMDENNRLCGDLASATEERYHEILAQAFGRADGEREIGLGAAGLSAREAAELFARAASGLKGPDVKTEVYRMRLASLVRVFVAGLRR